MTYQIKHEPRPHYACCTGQHNGHRSFRAAARCFVKWESARIEAANKAHEEVYG